MQSTASTGVLPPIALLTVVSAFGPIVMNSVLPANSAVMQDLVASHGSVQLVLTVYLVAVLIAQFVLGHAADRFGRRPVMIGGLVVFAVGGALCAMAPNIELLLFGRFVQGFGASVCTFLPRTIIRDVLPRDRAASMIGYMTTAMMVAPLFGPMLGGWISDNASWRFMYVGLIAAALLLTSLSYFFLHETLPEKQNDHVQHSLFKSATILLKEREFVAVCLMMSGSVGFYYSFLGGGPFVGMEVRNMSATSYGTWFATVAIGYLSGNFVAGRYSTKFGAVNMSLYGQWPMYFGIILFWIFSKQTHPAALFLPMGLVAFSNGMTVPNMSSLAMSVRPELSASASGLSGSAMLLFGVVMTAIMGWALPSSAWWFYVVLTLAVAVCLVGAVMLRAAIKEH